MKVVRDSKFRHVFGEGSKQRYEDIRLSSKASESQGIVANSMFWAAPWESGGGGTVAVVPAASFGRLPRSLPLITGHAGAILDLGFNPFDDRMLLTASEDSTVKVWQIPDEGLAENMKDAFGILEGHTKKVTLCSFNPTVAGVVASASLDLTCRVWDLEEEEDVFSIATPDQVSCMKWNYTGSLLAVCCKDKRLHILDPRASNAVIDGAIHAGSKATKVEWLAGPTAPDERGKFVTTGFSTNQERQLSLWDMRMFGDGAEAINTQNLDQGTGALFPHFDGDTGLLFLWGKGDGNMRYYEVAPSEPFFHYVDDFRSQSPQKGVAFLPKRCMDVRSHEILRALKLDTTSVQPISFKVPRKGDFFQEDLFPDCAGASPSMSLKDWRGGAPPRPPVVQSMRPPKASGGRSGSAPPGSLQKRQERNLDASAGSPILSDLNAQLAEARARISDLERENRELAAKAATGGGDAEVLLAEADARAEVLEQEIGQLRAERRQGAEVRSRLEARLEAMEAENQRLQQEVRLAPTQAASMNAGLSELQLENAQLRAECQRMDDAQTRLEALERENWQLQGQNLQLSETCQQNASLAMESGQLLSEKRQMLDAKARAESLERENWRLQGDSEQLAEARAHLADMERDLVLAESRQQTNGAASEDGTARVADLERDLRAERQHLAETRSRLEAMERENWQLQGQLAQAAELRARNDDLTAENGQLRGECAQLAATRARNDALERETWQLQAEGKQLAEVRGRAEALEAERGQLRAESRHAVEAAARAQALEKECARTLDEAERLRAEVGTLRADNQQLRSQKPGPASGIDAAAIAEVVKASALEATRQVVEENARRIAAEEATRAIERDRERELRVDDVRRRAGDEMRQNTPTRTPSRIPSRRQLGEPVLSSTPAMSSTPFGHSPLSSGGLIDGQLPSGLVGRWLHSSGVRIEISGDERGQIVVNNPAAGKHTFEPGRFISGTSLTYLGFKGRIDGSRINWNNGVTWTRAS